MFIYFVYGKYPCSLISLNNSLSDTTTYSTDETVIGTYLGKPLYRKIVKVPNNIQLTPDTWNALGIIIPNISQLVRADETFYTGTFGFKYDNGLQIITSVPGFIVSNGHNIVVEYTKTTD